MLGTKVCASTFQACGCVPGRGVAPPLLVPHLAALAVPFGSAGNAPLRLQGPWAEGQPAHLPAPVLHAPHLACGALHHRQQAGGAAGGWAGALLLRAVCVCACVCACVRACVRSCVSAYARLCVLLLRPWCALEQQHPATAPWEL